MENGLTVQQEDPLMQTKKTGLSVWVWGPILIGVLLVGAFFRFTGINWDDFTHMHPDERFLTMVTSSLSSAQSFSDYFNTQTSTLNPNNRGYGFYVYGDLPIILTRYVGEWMRQTGYDQIHLVGRAISASFDLLTLLLVFAIADRLYRKKWLALLAASFYALAVLPIQLSHFYKEDTFMNFFVTLGIYFAVRILPDGDEDSGVFVGEFDWLLKNWRSFISYGLFGVALGLAVACKVNAAPLAVLLPVAAMLHYFKLPEENRKQWMFVLMRNLILAGLLSLLVFRIFQPYAFTGPSIFDFKINSQWLQNMKDLSSQSSGDVDFPPALQWARRPIWFSGENLVVWGLGIPLGVLGWAGFLWMAWRMLCGEWRKHLLIWSWTAAYFTWQSLLQSRTMRYQLPIYPLLVIMAAWMIHELWNMKKGQVRIPWVRVVSAIVGAVVLVGTFAWAFAFTRIYTRPFTRADASRWIYQNVPGAINLPIETQNGVVNQPMSFRFGTTLTKDKPMLITFEPKVSGTITGLDLPHVVDKSASPQLASLNIVVSEKGATESVLATRTISDTFTPKDDARGKDVPVDFVSKLLVETGHTYIIGFREAGEDPLLELSGPAVLSILTDQGVVKQALPEPVEAIRQGDRYVNTFTALQSGVLKTVVLDHVVDWEDLQDVKTVRLSIIDAANNNGLLATAELSNAFLPGKDPRGESFVLTLDKSVSLEAKKDYILELDFVQGHGTLAIYGSKQALESSWDDALPLGLDGFSPYDFTSGVYRSDLNFEMYWDDNADKLDRFTTILDQADYIFISSNRQWGTTVRVPERYPLTTLFYRDLLGCPADKDITWCYSVAEPGQFKGTLGFDLVKVDESEPSLGPIQINTQFAEEAFTVYDHPKVLIFKKTDAYDWKSVSGILQSVDLTKVVHLTPGQASKYIGDLMLPVDQLLQQRAGGTWADLFNRSDIFNQYPGLAAVLWYVTISLMGFVLYPFTRMALKGLPDKGYPFIRIVGMLVLSYIVWLLGSYGVPFSKLTISLVAAGLLVLNLGLAWLQRNEIREDLKRNWRYVLAVELVGLGFFILFLFVRLGNPDLWHAWKGGEKPMDFSYFNAVLKSTTFPPYDPWFAGGYINYYYYGFVLVGVPVKWLGIIPAIAYNIILPQLYSLVALGAFSVVWNIVTAVRRELSKEEDGALHPYLSGLIGSIFMAVLGNLGSLRMIWHGIMRIGSNGVDEGKVDLFVKLQFTINGIMKMVFTGAKMPYPAGDWYWIPSRAIPGESITEFPAFTFLYADLHAHMISLPLTLLSLGSALSIALGGWKWGNREGKHGWLNFMACLTLGGLAIGSLRPTNTWDFPTFLALGVLAFLYSAIHDGKFEWLKIKMPEVLKRILVGLVCAGVLAGLSLLFFQPFTRWFGQAYNSIDVWKGDHTPWWSYITHWGLFLFMIISWLGWETIDWMATTPASALQKLKPYQLLIEGLFILLVILSIGLVFPLNVWIGWFTLPLLAWAGVLLLRPGMPAGRRALLFMIGTGLALTLMVELIVLKGDLGRMNTVFKFYMQAWTLLSLSAAVAFSWVLPAVDRFWSRGLKNAWITAAVFLIFSAALFPLLGGTDKIDDRMNPLAPHTLDGMAYMPYMTFNEKKYDGTNVDMDLSQDYKAILWMQENIQGSPVIVEGNVTEYRWGNRYTIYTGLPSVVGWNWHQRQQRALLPETVVTDRVAAIGSFYNETDRQKTIDFLKKYDVSYIIVGVMEHTIYQPSGLAKYELLNGDLWDVVYHDKDTSIYKVKK
jgi:YYY domain-containing protein